jgi:hypothetical protein
VKVKMPHASHSSRPRRALVGLFVFYFGVFLVIGGTPGSARAQISEMDQSQFIDTLAREGMSELLLHLLKTHPPADPVLTEEIRVGQRRVQYLQAADIDAQTQAFATLRQGYLDLIQAHRDHERRPIWQTDLGEAILFNYLQGTLRQASDFYDFGVPDAAQREAFESSIAQALEQLNDADLRLSELETLLPQGDQEAQKRRVNSGLWDRMINQYYKLRTRYFLAVAEYLASLLPADHPLFANLGSAKNPMIPQQRPTVAEERLRLCKAAFDQVADFASDTGDANDLRRPAQVLQARALIALGQPKNAPAKLQAVLKSELRDLDSLRAGLTQARALTKQNQFPLAVDHLGKLSSHPLVTSNLLAKLLLTDAQHRTLLDAAAALSGQPRVAALAQAYQPYFKLLDEQTHPQLREQLRIALYRRWRDALPPQADLSQQPPAVVLAVGEISRLEGQQAYNDAAAAQQSGDDATMQQHLNQALPKFQTAQAVLNGLLQRGQLDPSIQAKALYNLGWAFYFQNPNDGAQLVKAAAVWIDQADRFIEQSESEEAIGNAEQILRPLYTQASPPPGLREAYQRAAQVMFRSYGKTPAASAARLFYGYYVLLPQNKLLEAADLFVQVPYGDVTYFQAQREMLHVLMQLHHDSQGPARTQLAQRINEAARSLLDDVQRGQAALPMEDQPTVLNVEGVAKLTLFDLLVDGGQTDEAFAQLGDFDERYASDPQIIQLGLEKRIVALAQRGDQLAQVEQMAVRMMDAFPNQAAAVVDRVLSVLDAQADALREQAAKSLVQTEQTTLRQQAQQRSTTASRLASMLVTWAQGKGLSEQELLPFQLIQAKALRMAGDYPKSLDAMKPLIAKFPDDGSVIHHYAESLHAVGSPRDGKPADKNTLITAAGQYDIIINGFPSAPFPDIWWNAWLRRLQISDLLNEGADAIPLRIQALRQMDPNMGGDLYRKEFDRLLAKHSH